MTVSEGAQPAVESPFVHQMGVWLGFSKPKDGFNSDIVLNVCQHTSTSPAMVSICAPVVGSMTGSEVLK